MIKVSISFHSVTGGDSMVFIMAMTILITATLALIITAETSED
ncbi:hypothetical protein [Psychrobacillus sp.]|nr:hypothetical protein [Psychrobacillus sp.]